MENRSETKKSDVTMRGKYLNPDTNDPMKIPAEFLDENGNWKMLDRREKSMLTEGQLYAYERFWLSVVDERILREAAIKKGYNEGREEGIKEGIKEGKQDIAKKMKQSGMSVDVIAEMTGLSLDIIDSL